MRFSEFSGIGDHDTPDSSVNLDPHRTEYEIRNYHKLDKYLVDLCRMVTKNKASGDPHAGMVAAGVLALKGPFVARTSSYSGDGKYSHAEKNAIEAYENEVGPIPEGTVIITTLSPCNEQHDKTAEERDGPSCTDLINSKGIQKVYCGFMDPTQDDDQREFNVMETANKKIRDICKQFADTFLDLVHENIDQNIKLLDPDIYGEELPFNIVKNIVHKAMAQVDPTAKVKISLSPEGYYRVKGDKIRLDFGVTADGGEINANIVNAYNSYKGSGIVTHILGECFKAAEHLWGKPTKFVMSAHEDRGDGVWQHIAQKLGAEWDGAISTYNENFKDGRHPEDKGDSARHGIPKHATISTLRKIAKQGGRRGQLAHWQANMRSGRNK